MRGRVARTHTNRVARRSVVRGIIRELMVIRPELVGIKRVAVIRLRPRILVYSAIKIKANSPALNSILNPDTSSDSPSAKSKGVRLVSARAVINHISKSGRHLSIRGHAHM